MKCSGCKYYETGCFWNHCKLTGEEYFKTQDYCTLVNDDNTVNYDDSYFKTEDIPQQYKETKEDEETKMRKIKEELRKFISRGEEINE